MKAVNQTGANCKHARVKSCTFKVQRFKGGGVADLLAPLDELDGNKLSCLLVAHQLCYTEVAATNIPYLRGRCLVSMAFSAAF